MVRVIFLLLTLALAGCTFTDKNGTKYHVIVGIGVVTTDKSGPVSVVKQSALGLGSSVGHGIFVGYGTSTLIQVQTNANAVIELNKTKAKIRSL